MKNNNQQIVINIVGDIMLGDSYHMLGIGVGSSIRSRGTQYVFEKVAPFLKEADVNIGNLECTFSNEECGSNINLKPYSMYSPQYVNSLKDAGFDILTLANNHTMQYGKEIFDYTEQLLNKQDIKTIGTVRSPLHIVTIKDMKIVFLNYSMIANHFQYADIQYLEGKREKMLEDVHSLSRENDHIIVLLHWGDEYIDYPDQGQIDLAHELIDAGSALIIGHHPHILQGVEHYKKGTVAYSIGNFVFDKPQLLQRQSVIVQAVFSKEGLDKIDLVPIYVTSNYQPEIASGKKKDNIAKILQRASSKITSKNSNKNQYERDMAIGLQSMRMQFYRYFLLHFYRYPPMTCLSLFRDAFKRKMLKGNE